jgi:two-component system LytT family response regulator
LFCSKNLSWFQRNIDSQFFVRIHRSYLINLQQVSKIFKSEGKVQLKNGELVPFSQKKSMQLWDCLDALSASKDIA